MGNLILANLNINSIRNKFDLLKDLIKDNIDILILTETKLDESFSESQFLIQGYSKPFRLDRNANGGGVMVYVREDIPSKLLNKHKFNPDIEGMFIEINLRKAKWLLFSAYHPPSQSIEYFFEAVSVGLDKYISDFDRIILAGDFNCQDSDTKAQNFLDKYNFTNLVKEPTCFKSIDNPSCIDLIITNKSKSFYKPKTFSSGLSDFHKMVLTFFKMKFHKQKPKLITYRTYKNFDCDSFKRDLNIFSPLFKNYNDFQSTFMKLLNQHAPLKQKFLRANEVPYMTKQLRKAIMRRSQLESKFYKSKIKRINYYTKSKRTL